jgi:hypothetical protein
MEVSIIISSASIILAIVFAAGILYNKVDNIGKRLDDFKDHPERIAANEADIKTLKQKLFQ